MSSIFNDKFTSLSNRIDRLDASRPESSALKEPKNSAGEPFAKILADLEPASIKASENAKLAPNDSSRPAISNLSSLEAERARARMEHGTIYETSSLKIGKGGVEIVPPAHVKMATDSVKDSTAKGSQMMPYLHSAKYISSQPPMISLPEVAPVEEKQSVPGAPNLLSIKQITQPKGLANLVGSAQLQQMISRVSQKHGVDPSLGVALARAESSLNPTAVSTDGFASKGLFQLLDSTGSELANDSLLGEENYNPFDPDINADLGIRYLRRLMDTFGNETQIGSQKTFPVKSKEELEKFSVAAFNAGEGRVTAAQHRAFNQGFNPTDFAEISRFLPKITQNHVARVMRYRSESLTG